MQNCVIPDYQNSFFQSNLNEFLLEFLAGEHFLSIDERSRADFENPLRGTFHHEKIAVAVHVNRHLKIERIYCKITETEILGTCWQS